ncbi:hypothetical protein ONZ45_g11749 [Pleurotus djamor]|nr:hypothetical protein ONZ45_g11749 [Pleurotus djamor]
MYQIANLTWLLGVEVDLLSFRNLLRYLSDVKSPLERFEGIIIPLSLVSNVVLDSKMISESNKPPVLQHLQYVSLTTDDYEALNLSWEASFPKLEIFKINSPKPPPPLPSDHFMTWLARFPSVKQVDSLATWFMPPHLLLEILPHLTSLFTYVGPRIVNEGMLDVFCETIHGAKTRGHPIKEFWVIIDGGSIKRVEEYVKRKGRNISSHFNIKLMVGGTDDTTLISI